ncbi:MAG: transposase [Bryobacteraceae bacterium]|nr:transposase [Bryobacteraceae bacterium]
MHEVRIHGWCLMHNHGHWIFEAARPDSIANLMRDMQSRYSHYLNVRYRETPWALIAPLFSGKNIADFASYLRTGPVNWTPRFDARHLDAQGFREFLRYLENNPVKAGLVQHAVDCPRYLCRLWHSFTDETMEAQIRPSGKSRMPKRTPHLALLHIGS